jgi:hypothetical protein
MVNYLRVNPLLYCRLRSGTFCFNPVLCKQR